MVMVIGNWTIYIDHCILALDIVILGILGFQHWFFLSSLASDIKCGMGNLCDFLGISCQKRKLLKIVQTIR